LFEKETLQIIKINYVLINYETLFYLKKKSIFYLKKKRKERSRDYLLSFLL